MEDKKKITPEERVEGILKRYSPIDHEYEKKLDRAVSKYFAGRRSNDSAFDDVFEFYYNKGDLSSADITIEEYDELDWNPSVRIQAEVVQSADLDDELFYYLRERVRDFIDDFDDDDDDDDEDEEDDY
jgi:hypothetical protein